MKKTFLFFTFSLLLFSCKKEDAKKDSSKTRYDLLVNKKWQITGESGYKNGVFVPDDFASWEDYEKDDYITFRDDLTYEQNQGPLKKPGFQNSITDYGTWELTTSDKFISFNSSVPGTTSTSVKIIELTENKLSFQETDSIPGTKIIVNISFKPVP